MPGNDKLNITYYRGLNIMKELLNQKNYNKSWKMDP